ncbi:unnamed protein product [Ascophyllum nodosum]
MMSMMAGLKVFEGARVEAFAIRATALDFSGAKLGVPVHAKLLGHPSRAVRARTVADGGGRGAAGPSSILALAGSASENHRRSRYNYLCLALGSTGGDVNGGGDADVPGVEDESRRHAALNAGVDFLPSRALLFRGGESSIPAEDTSTTEVLTTARDKAVQDTRGGGKKGKGDTPKGILRLDKFEDFMGNSWDMSMMVLYPTWRSVRFCFGVCLLFYGMAFRTLAFHIIVLRISGLRQVQKSLTQLGERYREARKAVREAAEAAEEIGDQLVKPDELKRTRDRMIKEKERLLEDGVLSAEETAFFMRKYNKDLKKILDEQERFKSARGSLLSVNTAIDPQDVRSSLTSVYNALITSFTASTLQTAGQITLGLHIGSLLKTHVLDLAGPILDPIGYRLDLNTYFEDEKIPYMGKANAMGGPANMILNTICYSMVFVIFRVQPRVALKMSLVYYAGRVVTDYIVLAWDSVRRRLGWHMGIAHTPWSALIHVGLTTAGLYLHRNALSSPGRGGTPIAVVGPGFIGLLEPLVRTMVRFSEFMQNLDFFTVQFIQDSYEAVKSTLSSKA